MAISVSIDAVGGDGAVDPTVVLPGSWPVLGTVTVSGNDPICNNPLTVSLLVYSIDGGSGQTISVPAAGGSFSFNLDLNAVGDYDLSVYAWDSWDGSDSAGKTVHVIDAASAAHRRPIVTTGPKIQLHPIHQDHKLGTLISVDLSGITLPDATPVALWVSFKSSPSGISTQSSDFTPVMDQWGRLKVRTLQFTPSRRGIYSVVLGVGTRKSSSPIRFRGPSLQVG